MVTSINKRLSSFEYFKSLIIYFNTAAIKKLSRAYYNCLFKVFKFSFSGINSNCINSRLKRYNLFRFITELFFVQQFYSKKKSTFGPIQLHEWLEATSLDNSRYDLRSNGSVVLFKLEI